MRNKGGVAGEGVTGNTLLSVNRLNVPGRSRLGSDDNAFIQTVVKARDNAPEVNRIGVTGLRMRHRIGNTGHEQ